MKVGISSDEWRRWLREPIARGLLASVLLHFAFVTLFQSSSPTGKHQVVVINARLQPALPADQAALMETMESLPVDEPVAKPATDPVAKPIANAESLLTALTPSVAPPVATVASVPPPAAVAQSTAPANPVVTATVAVAEPQASSLPQPGNREASNLPSLPLGIDTNWYLARQVDKHPKVIGKVEPAYPEAAKRDAIEGTLKLKLRIDDLGRVQDAEVVEATPPGVFDAAALAAFRNARFQPAMREGRPVRYEAYIRVVFELKD